MRNVKPNVDNFTRHFVYDKGKVIVNVIGTSDYRNAVESITHCENHIKLDTLEAINELVSVNGWAHQAVIDEYEYDAAVQKFNQLHEQFIEVWTPIINEPDKLKFDAKLDILRFITNSRDNVTIADEYHKLMELVYKFIQACNFSNRTESAKYSLWRISWIESERGWGQKHSHYSYHVNKDDARGSIKQHGINELKLNPSGAIPTYYIYPEQPQEIFVSKQEYVQQMGIEPQ